MPTLLILWWAKTLLMFSKSGLTEGKNVTGVRSSPCGLTFSGGGLLVPICILFEGFRQKVQFCLEAMLVTDGFRA
jgi:hypothetical protein